jgi:hypothetical protein
MLQAIIKVSRKRKIEHNDADAAGFTSGYWWTLEMPDQPEIDKIESAAPTREEAIATATAIAQARGPYKVVVLD